MRKILLTSAMLLLIGGLATGCGSDSSSNGKDKTTADAGGGDATTGGDAITGVDGTTGGDATSGKDAGSEAKYQTCSEIGDCVAKACAKGEKDCEKPCLADGDEAALMEAVPLLSCYQSKCVAGQCKDSKEPNCNDDCLTQHCIGDFMKCIDTPATGDKVCSSAFGCFDACDVAGGDGFACYTKCVDGLTAEDTKLITALGKCMAANPGKDPQKACAKEMGACMIGSKAGDQACYTTFKCSSDCQKAGGKEDTCTPACLGKLTKEGQQQFLSLIPCLGGDKMNSDPKCQAALKTCIDPGGKATCADVFSCVEKCPNGGKSDDPSCMFECLHDTDAATYDTFLELAACNQDDAATGPGGVTPTDAPGAATPTDKPTSEACMKSMVTCAAPSGTGGCPALFACVSKCQADDKSGAKDKNLTCIFECAPKASKQAFTDLIGFATCNDTCEANCKGKDKDCKNACVLKTCPAESKACFPGA